MPGRKQFQSALSVNPQLQHLLEEARNTKVSEAELRELKLARERRDLIRVEVAARLFRRHVHEARTQLTQLPDELAAELAAAVPRKRLAALRDRIRRRVDGACRALADLLAAEELEPAEEDGGQTRIKDEG